MPVPELSELAGIAQAATTRGSGRMGILRLELSGWQAVICRRHWARKPYFWPLTLKLATADTNIYATAQLTCLLTCDAHFRSLAEC